jgi:hypothetical protein
MNGDSMMGHSELHWSNVSIINMIISFVISKSSLAAFAIKSYSIFSITSTNKEYSKSLNYLSLIILNTPLINVHSTVKNQNKYASL